MAKQTQHVWVYSRSEKVWFAPDHQGPQVWFCRGVGWKIMLAKTGFDAKSANGRNRVFRSREAACVAAEGYQAV